MSEYKEMYSCLFNAITDALEKIDTGNYAAAKEILILAQINAEEIFISAGEK